MSDKYLRTGMEEKKKSERPSYLFKIEIIALILILIVYNRFKISQTGMPIEKEVALRIYLPFYLCIIMFTFISILIKTEDSIISKSIFMNGIISLIFFGVNIDKELHSSYHITLDDMLNPRLTEYTISINTLIIMFVITIVFLIIYFFSLHNKK